MFSFIYVRILIVLEFPSLRSLFTLHSFPAGLFWSLARAVRPSWTPGGPCLSTHVDQRQPARVGLWWRPLCVVMGGGSQFHGGKLRGSRVLQKKFRAPLRLGGGSECGEPGGSSWVWASRRSGSPSLTRVSRVWSFTPARGGVTRPRAPVFLLFQRAGLLPSAGIRGTGGLALGSGGGACGSLRGLQATS